MHDRTPPASETNVLKALHLTEADRATLRRIAGNYQSLHQTAARFPIPADDLAAEPLSGREKRLYHHAYGRGYTEAVGAVLGLLAGEIATGMFTAYAEPVEGPASFAGEDIEVAS